MYIGTLHIRYVAVTPQYISARLIDAHMMVDAVMWPYTEIRSLVGILGTSWWSNKTWGFYFLDFGPNHYTVQMVWYPEVLTHLHLADGAAPGVAIQKRGLLEPWDFGANQKWFVILTFCHVMAILTSVSKAFKSLQWARVEGWQCVYCRPFFQSWGG